MVRLSRIAGSRLAPTPAPLKLVLVAVVGVLSLEILASLPFMAHIAPPLVRLAVLRGLQILIIVGGSFFLAGTLAPIGLSRERALHGIRAGLVVSAGFGAVVAVVGVVLLMRGIVPWRLLRAPVFGDPSIMAGYMLIGAVLGPIAEEVFFRGVVYGFCRRWGAVAALVVSTSLFVFAHPNLNLPVTQLVGGVLFALTYEFCGSLWGPIMVHVSGNSAIFVVNWLVGG